MTSWRLRIRPRSQWATPFRADSLFGAICWRWSELFPETFVDMLASFHEGNPSFMLSDGFPGDLLPLPLHAAIPARERKAKPPLYISEASFRSLARGRGAVESFLDGAICASSRVQTAIDRERGSAADGQLFEVDTEYLQGDISFLSVYIRSEQNLKEVAACLRALGLAGFGKKSSTGLGAFDLLDGTERCEWLDNVSDANAFVTLSHFVPAADDPIAGRWRVHVTFPKFHANAVSNVFKGSILMLAPGSIFRASRPRSWYGSMIPMPRPEMPRALHYGLSFAVPMVWAPEVG